MSVRWTLQEMPMLSRCTVRLTCVWRVCKGDVTSFAGVLRMSERNMKTWLHYYGTVVPDQASPTEVFELLKDALGF